jgi:hypothetical protein
MLYLDTPNKTLVACDARQALSRQGIVAYLFESFARRLFGLPFGYVELRNCKDDVPLSGRWLISSQCYLDAVVRQGWYGSQI